MTTFAAGVAAAWVPSLAYAAHRGADDPWDDAQRIRRRIRTPHFPHRRFNVVHFGAIGDGATDCTGAINAAISFCHHSGGGQVVVPAGDYLTGAIRLRSNVNLHVSKHATLRFSTDPQAYLPVVLTRWEGNDCYNYSPLIYAYKEENVAITGGGTLDGQADLEHWWPWKQQAQWGWKPGDPGQNNDSARLRSQGGATAPLGAPPGTPFTQVPVEQRVYGSGHYLRPAFVQTYGCDRVLIQGITITRSPFWLLHPVFCSNVTIRGYTAASLGTNNDGCNPESCDHVLIEDCTFDTGDDCIAIKAGRGLDGLQSLLANGKATPSQNIVVRGCTFANGHGGLTAGSEMSGGVRNVYAEDLLMTSEQLDIALRFKTNSYRGGAIENIHVRNVAVPAGVADRAISIDYFYEEGAGGPFRPIVRDVFVSNMTVGPTRAPDPDSDDYAIFLRGFDDDPIGRIRIADAAFFAEGGNSITNAPLVELDNVTVNGLPVS